jgi:hypothetical protein
LLHAHPHTSCGQLSQSQDQFVTQFKGWLFSKGNLI